MTLRQFLLESLATVRSSRVPSTLIAVLAAVMCAGTLLTVGRTVAAEQVVQARMDTAGSRVLVFRDVQGTDLLPPQVIDAAAHLSVTERAAGLTVPVDVFNGAVGQGGPQAPSWTVVGDMRAVATLTSGRWPRPGEALVSDRARAVLNLTDAYGWVSAGTDETAIVGTYTARAPFELVADGVLVAAPPGTAAASMHLVATSAADVGFAENQAIGIVNPSNATDLAIESPASLAELQQQVGRDLGGFNRSLVLGVLGAGAALVGMVVLADVLVRRRDLGRRRALGATRSTIVALVVLRTGIAGLAGACIGAVAGYWLAGRLGANPGATFAGAVAVLSILTAIASSIPPAVYAARADPVQVLRTP